MANYAYVAVDPRGSERRGTLEVSDQSEALRRIKQMGLYPTRVLAAKEPGRSVGGALMRRRARPARLARRWFSRGVKPAVLAVFTRQLATLVEAGMPLLRSLQTLEQQAESRVLKRVTGELSLGIESGNCFAEAISAHPKIFNELYVNMVRAGEISGALEVTLRRLAGFLEKAQRIKGKVKAAMYYPCAVLAVAVAIVTLLMVYVVPRFKEVFEGLLGGASMPPFTMAVLNLSQIVRTHFLGVAAAVVAVAGLLLALLNTPAGRWTWDRCKLHMPLLGPVFRKAAISRFSRTLGTLMSSGVPILQALTIVKDTVGNVIVSGVVSRLHDNVKQGDPLAPTLKTSRVFPTMVSGMVDVGEQTGALPEMLLTIANNYDEEVDNAVNGMTSLLEPIMIVLLAIVVGSIVVALFLPLVTILLQFDNPGGPGTRAE